LGLLSESIAYFVGGALGILVAVRAGIPFFARQFGIAPVFGWFLTSGVLVTFFFFAAIIAARHSAGASSATDTLRALNLRRLQARDLAWAVGGLVAVVVLTGAVVGAFSLLFSIDLLSRESYSSFLQIGKLRADQYWIFLVWLPYFFFNIAGEELLWRGYLLPRQERAIGSKAWLVNGLLWAVLHSALGLRIAAILLPIEFVVPYVVQRRKNTWLGIIIHGIYNGSGFISVALGLGM
jgi:CAAX amino terminal protease family.